MGVEKFEIYFYLYNTQVLHGYISDNRWEIVVEKICVKINKNK